jgi:drug/metabolite transporter (DMT)-like permease
MSYLYCVPPLAVVIGAVALGESVTGWLVLGGALVIGGVAVAQRGPRRTTGIAPESCAQAGSGQPC